VGEVFFEEYSVSYAAVRVRLEVGGGGYLRKPGEAFSGVKDTTTGLWG
jgi:hypothetical protein